MIKINKIKIAPIYIIKYNNPKNSPPKRKNIKELIKKLRIKYNNDSIGLTTIIIKILIIIIMHNKIKFKLSIFYSIFLFFYLL